MTPRKLVQRWMPDAKSIRENKYLCCFGTLLHDKALWHISRHTLAKAFLVGLFCAMLPIPFQMLVAATGAIALHANLPVSVGLVWLTNPLTMPPVFYAAYKFGSWLLDSPEQVFHFEASMEWAMNGMMMIWQPFLLGCLTLGILLGVLGFVFIHITWRGMVLWRWKMRHDV
ncbi:MAG: DUF2062 domain-containing protein [Mariprofundaceae bacterium]|nr:DUF2062 domain-containing protein [Mariprofundaceae bacterium]